MTTQSHIAKLAKTSLKTVSRVINKDPLVNSETRARVEKIIAEVGYQPSQAARMMRSQTSNIIGFMADRVATTTSSIDLIRGAQDVAWESGKHMMLFNIEQGQESEQLAASQLSGFRAEAVIHATVNHQEVRVLIDDMPGVLLNCFEAETRFPTVLPDDRQLAFDLMNCILDKGYRNPLFLNLSDQIIASRLRAEGAIAAAAARGIDLKGRILEAAHAPNGDPASYRTAEILTEATQSATPPDVIICGQDLLAISVYSILADLGLKVGKDMAVASFDNLMPLAGLLLPGLTTVELPYYEMGRAAMKLAIEGASAPKTTRLPGRIVKRHSL